MQMEYNVHSSYALCAKNKQNFRTYTFSNMIIKSSGIEGRISSLNAFHNFQASLIPLKMFQGCFTDMRKTKHFA